MRSFDCLRRLSSARRLFAFALVALACGAGAPLGRAEDEQPTQPPPAQDPPPAAPGPADLLKEALANPKDYKDLVESARMYFDLEQELWSGRKALLSQLETMATAGKQVLKQPDFVRWLVYQARSFEPSMTDRKWQKAQGIELAKKLSGNIYGIKSEKLAITFNLPKDYPKEKDLRTKFPRQDPYPMLLALHEKQDDINETWPGEALMKRRYPKQNWEELHDQWLSLCPMAAAGNYLDKDGMVRSEVLKSPFSQFWKHYHVDFDRIVLDGNESALAVASSMGIYFAGIVFRGDWTLKTDAEKATVRNFAPVPVYVVDNPELAKQLKAEGHPNVTAGISGPILMKWMNERRRVMPKSFEWSAQVYEQVLAYWVSLSSPDWGPEAERMVRVDVVDTPASPNTVRIDARGVRNVALYLSDDVVDLDRKVRVEVNGNVEFEDTFEFATDRMKLVGRDLDVLFNREPVRIRESMYFGWLMPARIATVEVRARKVEAPPDKPSDTPVGPAADADQESTAKRYMDKVEYFEKRGNVEQAVKFLELILELPANKQTEEARKKLTALTQPQPPK